MQHVFRVLFAFIVLLSPEFAAAQGAPPTEKRIGLVIGNGAYQAGALNTPANDAGLIAQTLQAAGFDVVGARDLDQDTLRRAFRDFVEKAQASGPGTVAFVYLSGYGLQLEGENYFVPIDAKIARDSDVPVEAVRISDYTRPLAALKLKANVVVLDAARANPFAASGARLAGGLALAEPEPGTLIAFNAAPGTVAPEGSGPYGPYAQALAEMLREGGLPVADLFDRVRLRVNDMTKGAQVPWNAARLQSSFVFFERGPDAPPPAVAPEQTAAIRDRPIRDFDVRDAYIAALERDTLQGYLDFLAAYPDAPMARRVRAIVAARREAITWRRTRVSDSPPAYWSYLRRYPDGPHADDARRRLSFIAAVLEPPPSFAPIDYDVPPPPPDEVVYFERPVLAFDDPVFGFEPPPPPPVFFLPPPPPDFIVLAPPPPAFGVFVLPIPVFTPVPVWVRPPVYIAPPPPNNVIFANIHNTVIINNQTNVVTVTNTSGQTRTFSPAVQAPATSGKTGLATPTAAIGPALPPSVARKAIAIQSQGPQGTGTQQGTSGQPLNQQGGQQLQKQPLQQPLGQQLPGTQGQPLPPTGTRQQGQSPTSQGQSQTQQQGQSQTPQQGKSQTQQQGQSQAPQQGTSQTQQGVQSKPGVPTGLAPSGQSQTQQSGQTSTEQQKQQLLQQERQKAADQERQKQLDQQRQQQERQKAADQQRQQQERQRAADQQRQQQLEQQRAQQAQQQRQQQLEQQRAQQAQQQRQQQLEQQRAQQAQQQRQQQLEQQRAQQIQQQRQQQIQQQQRQPPPPPQAAKPQPQGKPQSCGKPGQPACPK
jgi:uncharacterized caspase-like protein